MQPLIGSRKTSLKGLEEVSTDTDHQDWSPKTFPVDQVARTPKDGVEIFKEAVHKTYTDPEFINEYRKPTGGDEPTPLMPDQQSRVVKEMLKQ